MIQLCAVKKNLLVGLEILDYPKTWRFHLLQLRPYSAPHPMPVAVVYTTSPFRCPSFLRLLLHQKEENFWKLRFMLLLRQSLRLQYRKMAQKMQNLGLRRQILKRYRRRSFLGEIIGIQFHSLKISTLVIPHHFSSWIEILLSGLINLLFNGLLWMINVLTGLHPYRWISLHRGFFDSFASSWNLFLKIQSLWRSLVDPWNLFSIFCFVVIISCLDLNFVFKYIVGGEDWWERALAVFISRMVIWWVRLMYSDTTGSTWRTRVSCL